MKKVMLIVGIVLLLGGGYHVYASGETPEVVENDYNQQMELNDTDANLKEREDSGWMSSHQRHHRQRNHRGMFKKGPHKNDMMNHHERFNCHR